MHRELCAEAIRLARILAQLMPDEPEALGLVALMLLHDARRAARIDDAGELVPLEEQDRTRWDAATIAEGVALLEAALRRGRPGGRADDGGGAGSLRSAVRLSPAARHSRGLAPPPRPLRRRGRAYREALELATTDAERRYLRRRLTEVTDRG